MKPQTTLALWVMSALLLACGEPAAVPLSEISRGAPGVSVVKDNGAFTLFKDGQPFHIRGAAGDPAFLKELALAGGNCLRVYDTLGLARVLDAAEHYGIVIIADLPLPESQYLDFYRDEKKVKAQFDAYRDFVQRHKDHPALLMWMLGNELDFPYRPKYGPFYRAYNDLLAMIGRVDGQHPVATALTNFQRRTITNIQLKIPDLKLLGINTFGRLQDLEQDIADFAWMWKGPYLVSEWSINGYWEVPKTAWGASIENTGWKKQEELLQRFYQEIPANDPRFIGSCLFYWGQKQESTATWFNVFTAHGQPTPLYPAFAQLNKNTVEYTPAPPLNYMLIDGMGGQSSVILKPGMLYDAELVFKSPPDSNLLTDWSLTSDDWYSLELDTIVPVVQYDQLLMQEDRHRVAFCAPEREGPYRLFVELQYPGGIVATANTPFYVVE